MSTSIFFLFITSMCSLLIVVHFQASYLAQDELFREGKIWTQFFDRESSQGLGLDGLAESHAIEVNRHRAGLSFFDTINRGLI